MMAPVSMAAKSSSSSKDENNNHSSSSSRRTTSARPQEQGLKCPRCDSQNTKFCYYNNYSLTQPRHFCKTCRRYWTKGGALRSVPIGGGCRKNKKSKPSSSRLNTVDQDSKDSNISSHDIGGFKFFHGLTPAMEFQLGGLSFSRPNNHYSSPTGLFNQFSSSFGDISTSSAAIGSSPCFSLDPLGSSAAGSLMGFNFPFSSVLKPAGEGSSTSGLISGDVNCSSLASSIESLSSINQDLHLKLQQQRLAMLYVGENQKENNNVLPLEIENPIHQKPQPILFHNLETTTPRTNACGVDNNSRKEDGGNGNLSTEWFFDHSNYAPVTSTPTNNSSNGGTNENVDNWNNGINQAAWSNLSEYSAL
ncbi:hypothetical protein ACH5RR_012156 [Cinchona calisaya]|uniref:Dof zinc finger protein n=1 Tax=Cinchona calisaya TaxID=153742 RepID=A0ABD3AAC7_9GENT